MAALQSSVVIPSELLPQLLFQKMIRIGQKFRDGIGRDGIVVAADLSVSIDQNHSRAVQRLRVFTAASSGGKFEPIQR